MNLKRNIGDNTVTRNLCDLAKPTGNIYESVVIIAKRSNQIAAEIKQELSAKLAEFSNTADTLIEISKYYEKLPKPTLIAIDEFQHNEIYYRTVDNK